jgi:phenylacetate-CoA ligase
MPSLKKALVSARPFRPACATGSPSAASDIYQCYATADLGLIAYETTAREGLVLDEGVIVEIVRPGTGDPVPEGEVGELVVTTLNPDYPLIRFGTGDLSAVLPGAVPHGPHQHAHQGLDGARRPDHQGARHVRAPWQVADHRARFPQVVGPAGGQRRNGQRPDGAQVETTETMPQGLAPAVSEAIREVTKLRGEVEMVAPAACPTMAR